MDRRRPDLRNHHIYRKVHRVLRHFLGREAFRVVHVSIQNQHLHLLVEAQHRKALARNMQSLTIRLQRQINGELGRLFPHRYHAVQITTAQQARNALSYVLNNWRRHRLDWCGGRLVAAQLDEFSSAMSFTGWQRRFSIPAGYDPLPVSPPRTWLLALGWRDYGLLDPMECPGPIG
jgi:REP element-mobilizing transposase RayT